MEAYIQNLPSGYQIDGRLADGTAASPDRPLTVHMVPSSSVRLVATPEAEAAATVLRPPRPPPAATLSAFSLVPSDTFSELLANLISPYLVDSDGVLLTSTESGADLGDDADNSLAGSAADSTATTAARLTDCSPQEGKSVISCSQLKWGSPISIFSRTLQTCTGF